MCYILYTMYCITRTEYHVLYTMYCIVYAVWDILYICIIYSYI